MNDQGPMSNDGRSFGLGQSENHCTLSAFSLTPARCTNRRKRNPKIWARQRLQPPPLCLAQIFGALSSGSGAEIAEVGGPLVFSRWPRGRSSGRSGQRRRFSLSQRERAGREKGHDFTKPLRRANRLPVPPLLSGRYRQPLGLGPWAFIGHWALDIGHSHASP